MLYQDPSQQSQPSPAGVSPTYNPVPNSQPGYAVPVTDKMSSIPAPAAAPSSNAWYQPDATWRQPGQPLPPQQPGQAQPPSVPPQKPKRSRARSVAIFGLTLLLAVVFGVGLFSGWTFSRSSSSTGVANSPASTSTTVPTSSSLSALETARENAVAKVMPSVVEIVSETSQGEALGSGVIIDKSGDIVTNNHVVDGTNSLVVVLSNGSRVAAQVVGTKAANDLAIVRIQPFAGMVVAALGDSSKLSVGQEVMAIGNPLGYAGTATEGVVSALNRTVQESRSVTLSGLIQTSAPINPGNSGGALIDLDGQVVGIPTLGAVNSETNSPANGLGFAIPSNQVKTVIAQVLGNQ